MMSKKDFQAAAKIVLTTEPKMRHAVAEAFTLLFTQEKNRFDMSRFLKACDLDEDDF